jgi:hypothetical protein
MRPIRKPHRSTFSRRAFSAELALKKKRSLLAKIGWTKIFSFGISAAIVVCALVAVFDTTQ